MDSRMLWINEGFVLDEAGNLITPSYVDLRAPESRTPIKTLVKGCRREHALEDTETILVSPVKCFREKGENLIRDDQEGLATETIEAAQARDAGRGFQAPPGRGLERSPRSVGFGDSDNASGDESQCGTVEQASNFRQGVVDILDRNHARNRRGMGSVESDS